jgi:hypothetical protein
MILCEEIVEAGQSQINLFQKLSINSIMRSIVNILDAPIKVVLIIMFIISIIMIGELLAEWMQRRYIDLKVAKVIDTIKNGNENIVNIVMQSKILNLQKDLLLEVLNHKDLSKEMIENLAVSLS